MTTIQLEDQEVNLEVLDEELRGQLGDSFAGLSFEGERGLTVHVLDGVDGEALRAQIEAVIKAHDPTALTKGQRQEAARKQAAADVAEADLGAMAEAIVAATTLEGLRPLLLEAVGLMGKLALLSPEVAARQEKAEQKAKAAD